MNLHDLKTKTVPQLQEIAQENGIEDLNRSRKQDIIFAILKRHAKTGADIFGQGGLER